jgi:protein subunit release factor B
MKKRRLLFSVTAKDCDMTTFCGSGPGGQHRNKNQTAVRFRHRASGAVGESQTFKSQHQNKKAAWKRMSETKTFKSWIRLEAARRQGQKSVEQIVEEEMTPKNIKTEFRNEEGRWEVVES